MIGWSHVSCLISEYCKRRNDTFLLHLRIELAQVMVRQIYPAEGILDDKRVLTSFMAFKAIAVVSAEDPK